MNIQKLSRTELLFLDCAFKGKVFVPSLWHEDFGMLFNRLDEPMVGKPEILALLRGLSDQGLLFFSLEGNHIPFDLDVFEKSFREPMIFKHVCYGLTSEGGDIIENYLGVRWEHYVSIHQIWTDDDGDPKPSGILHFACGSEACLRIVIKNYLEVGVINNTDAFSLIRKECPWQPVYWKTLDCGYLADIHIDQAAYQEYGGSWSKGVPNWKNELAVSRTISEA